MKTTIFILALSLTVSGMAQESSNAAPVDFNQYKNAPLITKPSPDYFGEIKKPDHHVRNRILIGAGVAAGVAATVFLTHGSVSDKAAPFPSNIDRLIRVKP